MLKTRSKEETIEEWWQLTEAESDWLSIASSGSDLRRRRSTFPPQNGAMELLLLTDDTLRVVDIFLVGHDCTPSTRKKKIFQCDFLPAAASVGYEVEGSA